MPQGGACDRSRQGPSRPLVRPVLAGRLKTAGWRGACRLYPLRLARRTVPARAVASQVALPEGALWPHACVLPSHRKGSKCQRGDQQGLTDNFLGFLSPLGNSFEAPVGSLCPRQSSADSTPFCQPSLPGFTPALPHCTASLQTSCTHMVVSGSACEGTSGDRHQEGGPSTKRPDSPEENQAQKVTRGQGLLPPGPPPPPWP